jgi:hypothetical protein
MKNKVIAAMSISLVVIGSAVAVYKIASNSELRHRLAQSAKDVFDTSKKKVEVMSEDVAVRTAQVTKNPKICQDWVEEQWEKAL